MACIFLHSKLYCDKVSIYCLSIYTHIHTCIYFYSQILFIHNSSSTVQFLLLFPYNINLNHIYVCVIPEASITTALSFSNPTKSSVPHYSQNNLPPLLLVVIPTHPIQISFQIHNKIEQ